MIRLDGLAPFPRSFDRSFVESVDRWWRRLAPRFPSSWRPHWPYHWRPPQGDPEEEGPDEADAPLERPYPWEEAYPPGVAWDLEVPRRPLFALLDDAVARYGDRLAIDCLERRYSYAELGRLVERAARGFQALGVDRGVRVGLLLPNTPFFIIAYFGVLKAGGTVVNMNPLYAEAEIAHILEDAGVHTVVTIDQAAVFPKLERAVERHPVEQVVVARSAQLLSLTQRGLYALLGRKERAAIPRDKRHLAFDQLIADDGAPTPVTVDPDHDIAVLQYTGGLDGEPKGAMLTHTNLLANARQTQVWYGAMDDSDEHRFLGALPLGQAFGISGFLHIGLAIGAALILLPRFSAEEVVRAIDRKKVTAFPGVPTMFAMVLGYRKLGRYDLSSLRYALAAGAPLPASVQRRFESLTGARLIEGYGLTEAAPVVTINTVASRRRGGSVGLPMPGTVVEIVSLEHPRRRLPTGVVGEVCVRGPQVMAGYWNRPEATAEAVDGDRLHTGDLGYLDEDGFLYLTGRIKRLILVGGYNVFPAHVERAIARHPAVAAAEVSGMGDSRLGERVHARVQLQPGATLTREELRAHLKTWLAPFEIPREVAFVEASLDGAAADEAAADAERSAEPA